MHLLTPTSRFLLVIMVISGFMWTCVEIRQFIVRKRHKKKLLEDIHKEWTDLANDRAEWNLDHFENEDHPHQQWFIRLDVYIYQRYLNTKGRISPVEIAYLSDQKAKITQGIYRRPE